METLNFLTKNKASEIRENFGSPAYVYSESALKKNASSALSFPNKFGLTVRYAMKACSNASILRLFDKDGIHIDASSGFEVHRAIRAGISPEKISLSSQEFPEDFVDLFEKGIHFNACSLSMIEKFGKVFPEESFGLRINPGVGSGGSKKTNVGGPSSSFGIWHEQISEAKLLIEKYKLKVVRIHTHIGSGSDPKVWEEVAKSSIDLLRHFPDATYLNLGGGFKVARMSDEPQTNLKNIGKSIRDALSVFHQESGRKIHLEIEPGTFLVANACSLLTTVKDIVTTGNNGYSFLKLNTGLTEIMRPALYGAQHPIIILSEKESRNSRNYIVVGHCCESGDLITTAQNEPDSLEPRELSEADIGDICIIEGVGAYCSSMCAKNYNSFPEAPELLICENGDLKLIRKRQTLEQIIQNEIQI